MLRLYTWSSLCLAPLLIESVFGYPAQEILSSPPPPSAPTPLNYTGYELRRYGISNHSDLVRMVDIINRDNVDVWQLTQSHVDLHMDTANLPEALISRRYTTLPFSFPYSHAYAVPDNSFPASPLPLPDVRWLHNSTFHTAYHNLQEIELFVAALASTYPKLVEVVWLGPSWENRDVFAIRIGKRGGKHKKGKKGKKGKPGKTRKGKGTEGSHGKSKSSRGGKPKSESCKTTPRGARFLSGLTRYAELVVEYLGRVWGSSRAPTSIRDVYVSAEPAPGTQKHVLKDRIVIQGAQHAREWIATSTALYLAHALVVPKNEPGSLRHLLDENDFTIIPVPNPDGYTYTWTTDRLWYKNRMDVLPGTSESYDCKGVDMNRNWGYEWRSSSFNSTLGPDDPCSHWYPGAYPFQAPEVTAVANYIRRTPKIRAFVDLRSYGQKLMYPYSYTCDRVTPHAEDLIEASLGITKALRETHNVAYTAGASCELLYPAPGNIIDWMHSDAKVKYAYSLMLRDTGTYGFLLPPRWIQPTGEETAAAVASLAKFIEDIV